MRANRPLVLLLHKRHGVRNAGARGPVAVDLVIPVRKAERNTAHHPPVVAEPKMAPDQAGVTGQSRLRNGAEPQGLRRQQEIADIGAAIDRAVNPERLVGMNDGDMRRAEEIVIFQRLPAIGRLVAARDAKRVVELEAAFATAFLIDAEIFPWRGEVMVVAGAGSSFGVDQLAKLFLGLAARDHDLPGLAVAPRGGALRRRQNPVDDRARHRVGPVGAAGIPLVQQFLQHADSLLDAVRVSRHLLGGIRHGQRPLVGILLNGTSLSTRMSPGRPSTRSAMMLRRISSVPPAMRIDGDDISIAWNWPAASAVSGSVSTPLAPCKSIA